MGQYNLGEVKLSKFSGRPFTMKILIVGDHPDQQKPIDGGLQSATVNLATGLARFTDFEVHVCRIRFAGSDRSEMYLNDYCVHTIQGGRFSTLKGFSTEILSLKSLFRRIKPNILHGQSSGFPGSLVSRLSGPKVITFHGILTENAKQEQNLRKKFRIFRSILEERNSLAENIFKIFISRYQVRCFGQKLARCFLIPNPVDPLYFQKRITVSPKDFVFVGRLSRAKGVFDLLNAFKILRRRCNDNLFLVGKPEDQFSYARLHNFIADNRLDDRVFPLGELPVDQLSSLYARSRCLILPSYTETTPLVVQQAMASELPVIATSVGGVPDLLNNGECGLVVAPGDVEALAAAMATDISSIQVRKRVIKAKCKALEFGLESVIRRTVSVYEDCLQN